ncbi:MAG: HAD-IC family P-type ATPase, partial [Candidatus Margulisiibacteriota bacterium]
MFDQNDLKTCQGLSGSLVAERLRTEGFNELPSSKKRSIFDIAFEGVREARFMLLVAGGLLYLFLGDIQEAIMLLFFVFVVMGITLYQERKTTRALEALRDLSSPRALVIRDGQERRIPGREVVREDIIILREGDRIPADALLLSAMNLQVDESLLTGESMPVRKAAAEGKPELTRPGGDDLPFVYSSTLVVQGQGVARVFAVGLGTEIGKIGKALQVVETEETFLQKETGRLVKYIATIGLSLCLAIVIIYGLTRGNWMEGILAGITLAMAILPEEFPVVLTIFLALGAWRISQKQVLTRKIPAVETLGSTTVLCVDKTGTITQNRMAVKKIFVNNMYWDINNHEQVLPETFHQLVEFSILASAHDPFDPMEKAIKHFGDRFLAQTEHLHDDWQMVQEYPLSKQLLALSHVWKSADGTEYEIAAKGAPEAIADLCHFSTDQTRALMAHISKMADEGLRVLGVAKSSFQLKELPKEQ